MCIVATHLASGINGLEALPAAVARPVPVPIRGLSPPPSRDDGMAGLLSLLTPDIGRVKRQPPFSARRKTCSLV